MQQRPSQRNALPLPPRHRANGPADVGAQAKAVHGARKRGPTLQPIQPSGESQVLLPAQVRVHQRFVRNPAEGGTNLRGLNALITNRAKRRPKHRGHNTQKRRLARTIRTEQKMYPTGLELSAHTPQRNRASEGTSHTYQLHSGDMTNRRLLGLNPLLLHASVHIPQIRTLRPVRRPHSSAKMPSIE